MKKFLGLTLVIGTLVVGAAMLFGQNAGNNQIDNGPKYWGGPQYYYAPLYVPSGNLYVGGAVVTSTAYTGAVAAASVSGNLGLSTLTNAFTTATGVLLTNTCVAADGKTNTYVFVPFGGVYVLKSITTSLP